MAKKDKNPGESPTEILIKKLEAKEKSGMDRTKRWAGMWQQSLRYFFSSQLHGKKKHKDWDWVIVNYIWPSAIQEIAKLSKNYPKILTNGWEDGDAEVAETWQSALQWLWEKGLHKHGMRLEQIRAVMDGKLFGYRVSKVLWDDMPHGSWDDKAKEWIGDVKHRLWHPAEFWASDNEYIEDGDCGTVRYVTLEYAQRKWPNFKDKLKDEAVKYKEKAAAGWLGDNIRGQLESAGTYPAAGLGGQDKGAGSDRDANQLLDLILSSDKMAGDNENKDEEFVKICETYFYDNETTDEKIEEDETPENLAAMGRITMGDDNIPISTKTGQPMTSDEWPKVTVKEWKQPKYPNGRYVIRVGKTILNPDEVDQVYPYKQWPFVVSPHYLLPHMWQGTDAVQLYKSTQDMINVTVTHLANNLKQFGSPKIAIEAGAMAINAKTKKAYRIGRGPGAIIRLAIGGLKKFKIIEPAALSQSAVFLYGLFTQEFKNLFGLQSIAKGEKQPGKMTAKEATMLSISANDRIQLQSVFEDEWIKQICCLAAEICQKNYTVGRMIRIVGEDRIRGVVQITQREKEIRFDVDIEPGQTLPYDEEKRIVKYQTAYEMMQNPIANPMLPEMLRVLEISGWQKLLEKYEAWQVYYAFYEMREKVKSGEIEPEEAVKILVQKAMETFAQVAPQEEGQEGVKKSA